MLNCGKSSWTGKNILTDEQILIDLCERFGVALDINYLRGTVMLDRKRFATVAAALAEMRHRESVINKFRNFT